MATDDKPKTAGKMGKEIGQTGTIITSGFITQEEYNRNLTGLTGLRTYDTMRRSDATIGSILKVCKLPILSTQWRVESPVEEDNPDEEFKAKFIERELFKCWNDFLRQALTMFDFGFSVFEKVLGMTNYEGKDLIGIDKLAYRKQTSVYKWEMDGGKPGITQQLIGAENAQIPMEKLVVFTNEKEGDNYEGISLLRTSYKHWHIKDKLDLVNAIAQEKMAIGIPILQPPASANESEKITARTALRQLRANEEAYMELPEGWTIEMMDLKANETKDVIPTIQYHDRQITLSVLAQFLSLGASDASGSRAVSEDQSKLFMLSEEAAAKNIADTINEQIIKPLCDLNFSDMSNGYPELKFSKIGDENVAQMADAIQKLMNAKAITSDYETEEHIRKVLHLPEPSKEIQEYYEKRDLNAPAPGTMPTEPSGNPDTKKDNIDKVEEQEPKNKTKATADLVSYRDQLIQAVMDGYQHDKVK